MRFLRKRKQVSVTSQEAHSAGSVSMNSGSVKSVFLSKTFWANLLAGVGGVLAGDWMVSGLAVVNLLLRLFTSKSVTLVVKE